MAEESTTSFGKAKNAGRDALRKTKGALDTAYGTTLRNRVEEYADLTSTVLAAHEDRFAMVEVRLQRLEQDARQRTNQFLLLVLALVLAVVLLVLLLVPGGG